VMAVDPGTAAARQLRRSKGGDRDELERSHLVRRTDQGPSQGKALVRARAKAASELKKADSSVYATNAVPRALGVNSDMFHLPTGDS
jgi:hypothetical protein